ncbi:hypothetical protein B4096_2817 [Heyndrickxia coagulans]|nr:hypothetical protein B4096_2817 [Heyndrickxia coagulans]
MVSAGNPGRSLRGSEYSKKSEPGMPHGHGSVSGCRRFLSPWKQEKRPALGIIRPEKKAGPDIRSQNGCILWYNMG